jgi:type III restriction enzyme
MTDPEVEAKAKAAVAWCERASKHEGSIDGKPWRYLLIPHDAVTANATLKAIVERYARTE